MTTIREWAEDRGWVEPHWKEFDAEIIEEDSITHGMEYESLCRCGWISMRYVNDFEGACQALWAHYLNPQHRWMSERMWDKGRKWPGR